MGPGYRRRIRHGFQHRQPAYRDPRRVDHFVSGPLPQRRNPRRLHRPPVNRTIDSTTREAAGIHPAATRVVQDPISWSLPRSHRRRCISYHACTVARATRTRSRIDPGTASRRTVFAKCPALTGDTLRSRGVPPRRGNQRPSHPACGAVGAAAGRVVSGRRRLNVAPGARRPTRAAAIRDPDGDGRTPRDAGHRRPARDLLGGGDGRDARWTDNAAGRARGRRSGYRRVGTGLRIGRSAHLTAAGGAPDCGDNERVDKESIEGTRVSDQREPTKRARDATPAGDADRASAPAPETTPVPNTTPSSDASGDSPRNAIGAYLLDALPDDERAAFEAFLASSPEAQEELRQLAPVVSLLPQFLYLEQPGDKTAPAPTAALRGRILSGAEAEGAVTAEPAPMSAETDAAGEPMEGLVGAPAETAEESADATSGAEGAAPGRPRTVRTAAPDSGVLEPRRQRRAGKSATSRPMPEPLRTLRQFPTSWLAAAGLTVVAVGAVIWALALLGQIDNKEREIGAQRERLDTLESEIADLRSNANATAFTLS